MTPTAIMFFAAGFGTRMGALTQSRPKPLVPLAGRALMDYAIDWADAYGPLTRVANAHYCADQIAAHVEGKNIAVSNEAPDVLETGGGLKHALPMLGSSPVFTMNTDAVFKGPNPLQVLSDAWNADEAEALLLCVQLERAKGRSAPGDFAKASDGTLSWGGDLVYTGVQIIRTETIAAWQDTVFSLRAPWRAMQERGTLKAVNYDGQWCDVGRPECIPIAEEMLSDV